MRRVKSTGGDDEKDTCSTCVRVACGGRAWRQLPARDVRLHRERPRLQARGAHLRRGCADSGSGLERDRSRVVEDRRPRRVDRRQLRPRGSRLERGVGQERGHRRQTFARVRVGWRRDQRVDARASPRRRRERDHEPHRRRLVRHVLPVRRRRGARRGRLSRRNRAIHGGGGEVLLRSRGGLGRRRRLELRGVQGGDESVRPVGQASHHRVPPAGGRRATTRTSAG